MRIVVDVMGSDHHPGPDVAGAVLAAKETRDTLILVGPESAIKHELVKHKTDGLNIDILHVEEVITMSDKPSVISREKQNSTMHVGMNLVRDGHAEAFVTAGNTGAAYAIAMLHSLHRIPGVKRPALSAVFPINRHPVTFLDIGANADSKPEWLAQFAVMGSIFAGKALGLDRPSIGLLSNGEEEEKGSSLILEAGSLIQKIPALNFSGHIEPKEALLGRVDVVIADGFTGNILLKTFEATARYIMTIMREEISAGSLTSLGGLLAKPAFRRAASRLDTREIGGAPLLGVNGVVIIGHGSSDEFAIKNSVLQARKAVQGKIVDTIRENLAQINLF